MLTPCIRASAAYGSQNEQRYCPAELVHDHLTYLRIHEMDVGEKEYCMKSGSEEKEGKKGKEREKIVDRTNN